MIKEELGKSYCPTQKLQICRLIHGASVLFQKMIEESHLRTVSNSGGCDVLNVFLSVYRLVWFD